MLAAIGLLAAGCGSSSKSAATTPAPATSSTSAPTAAAPSSARSAASPLVVIKNFAYHAPASVPAGAKITVRNDDATTHTFSARGNAFDVNVSANSSTTFNAPSKPGHYITYCKHHGNMSGMLVVS